MKLTWNGNEFFQLFFQIFCNFDFWIIKSNLKYNFTIQILNELSKIWNIILSFKLFFWIWIGDLIKFKSLI